MELECNYSDGLDDDPYNVKPETSGFVNLRKKSNFTDDWPCFGPQNPLFCRIIRFDITNSTPKNNK